MNVSSSLLIWHDSVMSFDYSIMLDMSLEAVFLCVGVRVSVSTLATS